MNPASRALCARHPGVSCSAANPSVVSRMAATRAGRHQLQRALHYRRGLCLHPNAVQVRGTRPVPEVSRVQVPLDGQSRPRLADPTKHAHQVGVSTPESDSELSSAFAHSTFGQRSWLVVVGGSRADNRRSLAA
jgi:hypothetical protein